MTPEQVQLLRSSFLKVASIGDEAAALFYQRLFELDPGLRPLFRHDMATQGTKLMLALDTATDALDRPDQLLPLVRELGRRHAGYGVVPEHYATVGEALFWTLEQGLGAEFAGPTRRAWEQVFELLAETMITAGEAEAGDRQAA